MADATPRSPLEGDLITLRTLSEADGERLNPMFSDEHVLATLSVPFPQSLQGFVGFVRRTRESESDHTFAIEAKDTLEAIGVCGLHGYTARDTPEAGIWIGEPYWNTGFGTDALRTLCRFGFREMGLHRIHLHVYATNTRAVRSYEKVGFKMEGTMRGDVFLGGAWTDVHIMGLLAAEFEDPGR